MEADRVFLAVDQGSSGTMTALFNEKLEMIDWVDIPVKVQTPRYGWVEHDPWELLESVKSGAQQLLARHPEYLEKLEGIGLANQGESFLLWNRETKEPVTPVISWQDSRSEQFCSKLQEDGYDSWFHQKTGLHLSSEWPALKVYEMRREDPKLDLLCQSGNVIFGQLDAWFIYALSGGKQLASDHGTACRTGFYHLRQGNWDPELLKFFHGEDLLWPRLLDNVCHLEGMDLGIGREIPWIAGGLDQSVTLIGQRCIRPHTAKITYGTCCACWMNLGREILLDDRLTTSVAWKLGEEWTYALAAEGGASGSIITWLQDRFSGGWPLEELSDIACKYDDQPSLVFVPAFQGLSAPYWKEARGTLFGITTGTRPEHLLRAGLDAITYTIKDIIDCMPEFERLVVDGGMTANDYLLKKQADVLGKSIRKAEEKEGTLMGIAYLCALSTGILPGLHALDMTEGEEIRPDRKDDGQGYKTWKRSVQAVIDYYNDKI